MHGILSASVAKVIIKVLIPPPPPTSPPTDKTRPEGITNPGWSLSILFGVNYPFTIYSNEHEYAGRLFNIMCKTCHLIAK